MSTFLLSWIGSGRFKERSHIPHLTDLPPEVSRALGEALERVGNALTHGECH